MPFKSDKQRRYLWSQKPEVAKQIAHKQTGGGVYSSGIYDDAAKWHNARLAGIPQHVGFIDDPDDITETAATNPDDPYGGKYINPDRKAPLGKYTDLATYYTAKERALGRGEAELARMAAANEELKRKAAAQGFKFNEGGDVPMMDGRKPKKITQKDRYGNQVSVEYTDEQKPFDINSLFEKLLDQPIPEMLTIPETSPVGGGVSIGFGSTHPGEPRGSDTVPAWLTPGEFVVNKEAMDDPQNAAAVKAINDQGRQVQQMKHGGPLQMHRMSGGVPMDGATHMNQGGDTRGFFDRLKLLAGFEDTPAVPQMPTPTTVAAEQPIPTSRPMSPEQTLIQAREGYRPDVYEDTRGYNTVGFGHRTDEPLGSIPYTRAQNESNLDTDIETAKSNAESYAGDKWKDLNKQQKAALTSMALQLGGAGQREFELMQEALRAGDWAGVRREARDSDWFGQTPARVEDIEAAFRYGGGPIYAQEGSSIGGFGGWLENLINTPEKQAKLEKRRGNWEDKGQRYYDSAQEWISEDRWADMTPGERYEAVENRERSLREQQDRAREHNMFNNSAEGRIARHIALGRAEGGPIYAQSGTGIPNFGGPVMWDPETQSYVPQEQLMPDILAGQEEGAAQAVQDSQAITDQLNQEDLDMYGWNQAEGRPNTRDEATAAGLYTPEVPPFEAPTHTPEAVAKDDSEYQQRLAQQIAQAENMVAGGDGDDLGTVGGVPDVPPEKWYEGITDWAFGDEGTAAARQRNEEFNVKAAENNLESAQEELAEMEARIEAGEPVNEHTLKKTQEAVEHQQDKLIEAGSAAAAFQSEMDAEGVVAAETLLEQSNQPGPEDDKATLEELAESEEFEDEDAPDKDSDKGTQSTPEVEAAGEEAAKADPTKLDKAKGFFKDAFSDLFDGKELARMAIMYVGSRALGYSHGGSLNWAAKQYASRLSAKESSLAQNAKEFAKSGKYTPASVAAYQESGDLSKLTPVGVTDTITGNANVRTIRGQKVAFQEIKRGDNVMYKAPDGTVYTAAQLENATQPFEPAFEKGTKEYRARRSRATGDAAGRFEEVWKAEDTIPGGRDNPDSHFTKIRPKQAADEFWAWSESMGLDPESDEALQVMTQAYRQAIQDGKSGDVKPGSLKPYLEQQYIREKSGAPELFITNPDAKPGEDAKYIRGDKMASLDRNVESVATQLPALQGLSPKDAKDRFYSLGIEEWNALDDEVKKQYNRSATDDESGFYVFLNKRAGQLLTKSGG